MGLRGAQHRMGAAARARGSPATLSGIFRSGCLSGLGRELRGHLRATAPETLACPTVDLGT